LVPSDTDGEHRPDTCSRMRTGRVQTICFGRGSVSGGRPIRACQSARVTPREINDAGQMIVNRFAEHGLPLTPISPTRMATANPWLPTCNAVALQRLALVPIIGVAVGWARFLRHVHSNPRPKGVGSSNGARLMNSVQRDTNRQDLALPSPCAAWPPRRSTTRARSWALHISE